MADSSDTRNPSARKQLTAERLRELLHYDPETGAFTRRKAQGNKRVGDRAGHVARGTEKGRNYERILIDYRMYLSHRLAFLYMIGNWPAEHVDHINMDTSDNRWANLREADRTQNHANRKKSSLNKSGFKGVCWDTAKQKWRAGITVKKRNRHLGYFDKPEDAHEAYCKAASEIFGEYARTE